jgi:superoxide dismutase, Fe-Mn family
MIQYRTKTFDIPIIEGISQKQIDEHLKLYAGYVKHTNLILSQLEEWKKNPEESSYLISELRRRFGFEFDGIRSHEYYFGALEKGRTPLDESGVLGNALSAQFGNVNTWRADLIHTAMTRGSGWAVLYYHPVEKHFLHVWIDEHHLGHLSSLPMVLALDCWEHAYMVDYLPSERKKYVEAYLNALNWNTVNKWFELFTDK